jgi:putative hemolysin
MKNFFLIIFLSAVGFLGFEIWQNYGLQTPPTEISGEKIDENLPENLTEIANPASEFCEKNGGKLEIRKSEKGGGEVGFCVFDDETECEEWEFFRGECGADKIKKSEKSGDEKDSSEKSDSGSDKKTPVKMDAELPEELLELLQKNSGENLDKNTNSDSSEKSSEKSDEPDSKNLNKKNAEENSDEKTEEKSDSKTGELEAGETDSAKSFSDYLDSMNE